MGYFSSRKSFGINFNFPFQNFSLAKPGRKASSTISNNFIYSELGSNYARLCIYLENLYKLVYFYGSKQWVAEVVCCQNPKSRHFCENGKVDCNHLIIAAPLRRSQLELWTRYRFRNNFACWLNHQKNIKDESHWQQIIRRGIPLLVYLSWRGQEAAGNTHSQYLHNHWYR